MHRSPGGVSCEASFPCRLFVTGDPPSRPYTPAMRRWVCIVALLAGFAGDDYVRGVRLREPVAVERVIETRRRGTRGLVPTGAWWTRPTG
jgi:hypothetical protein